MPVTREKLFEEIWAEPMTIVASRYGVSSSFLTRVCERLYVPRPARGHWATAKVGQASVRPALPAPRPGDELVWVKAGDAQPPMVSEIPTAPGAPPKRRSNRSVDFTKMHPLVFRSEALFDKSRFSEAGYLRPWKQIMLDVYVSKPVLSYALDVANQLYQLLEGDGHRVVIAPPETDLRNTVLDEREERTKRDSYNSSWRPSRPTVVYIGTVAFGLTVYEMSESVSVQYEWGSKGAKYKRATKPPPVYGGIVSPWSKHEMPSGRLAVRACSPYMVAAWQREWKEEKPGDLVTRLPSIAGEIAKSAPELAAKVEEGTRRRDKELRELEAQRRKWEREERERRAAEARKQSRTDLIQLIDAWSLSMNLESFFRDVEVRLNALDELQRNAMGARIENARALLTSTNALEVFRGWKAPQDYRNDP